MTRRGGSIRFVAGVVLVTTFAGCSSALVGRWEADAIPTGEPFYIRQVQFNDDGSFAAGARQGDKDVALAGKYEFDGFSLKLQSPGKKDRQYGATIWWGKTLELRHDGKKQTMKKM